MTDIVQEEGATVGAEALRKDEKKFVQLFKSMKTSKKKIATEKFIKLMEEDVKEETGYETEDWNQ